MKTYNISSWTAIIGLIFYIIYNSFFGWNLHPINDTEQLFDSIFIIIVYISLFFLLISILHYYGDKLKIFRKGYHVYFIVIRYSDKKDNDIFELKGKLALKNQSEIINYRNIKKTLGIVIENNNKQYKSLLCNGRLMVQSISYLGQIKIDKKKDRKHVFFLNKIL